MTVTGLLDWLVVRQGLARRTYGAADAGLFVSFATYMYRSHGARARNQRTWFQIRRYERSGMRVSSEQIVREVSEDRRIASVIQ